MMTNNRSS